MDTTPPAWVWPVQLDAYDRQPALTTCEQTAIAYALEHLGSRREKHRAVILQRLLQSLQDVLICLGSSQAEHYAPMRILLREMDRRNSAYWGWSSEQWAETIAPSCKVQNYLAVILRDYVASCLHMLRPVTDCREVRSAQRHPGSRAIGTATPALVRNTRDGALRSLSNVL
jgi:hypothetical protein